MTRTVKQIVVMINALGIVEEYQTPPYELRRTYAGHWQHSSGAWSWYLVSDDGREVCGSMWSAKKVISSYRANRENIEVIPACAGRGAELCIVGTDKRSL